MATNNIFAAIFFCLHLYCYHNQTLSYFSLDNIFKIITQKIKKL